MKKTTDELRMTLIEEKEIEGIFKENNVKTPKDYVELYNLLMKLEEEDKYKITSNDKDVDKILEENSNRLEKEMDKLEKINLPTLANKDLVLEKFCRLFIIEKVLYQLEIIEKGLKAIEEKRKKPLIVNTGISCALSTLGGYTIDSMLDKPIDAFKDKFVKLNANDPKLHKYIGGIKIAKSALVFGLLYRFVVPVVSMFLAEKVVEKPDNKLNKKA